MAIDVGFFGKLPSHGDFLRRQVSDAFVGVWDGWLQECLAASRAELGERWLDIYLTSPVWRFACAAGVCGPAPVVGVMVPSVDRVGRYFPLTLAAELPLDASIVSIAQRADAFFDAAERLVIETLENDHIDFERFEGQLAQLGDRLESVRLQPYLVLESAAAPLADVADDWQIPIASANDLAATFDQMLAHLTEGLALMTGNTFTSFESISVERPESGARVNVERHGRIVVGRYSGIQTWANTIGYGQWSEQPNAHFAQYYISHMGHAVCGRVE